MIRRVPVQTGLLIAALVACFGTIHPIFAQKSNVSTSVILEVGKEQFTVDQIVDAYARNANRTGKNFYMLQRDSALDFLNLYANYRLKVQEALTKGIQKRPDVVAEIESSRNQLAVPPPPSNGYLIERKVVDPAVQHIFKLRNEELKVAVIYSAMNAEDPTDTMRAFQRSLSMLEQLRKGANFYSMATDSSDDPAAKSNAGILGWITGGMILRALEDAAYETPAGELYPGIVRAPSGFVVLKVLARAPRVKVRGAQILFEVAMNADTALRAATRKRAEDALQRIRNGEDFATVATEVSDDRTTAEYGGDFMTDYTRSLGFEAKSGKLVPDFENALFALNDGEVSDVVSTDYGFHIIKRITSHKPTFDEEKETIRQIYKQQFLYQGRTAYVDSLLESQGMQVQFTTLAKLMAAVNQGATAADTAWAAKIDQGLRSQSLYRFQGQAYTVGNWIDSIETHKELRATALNRDGILASIRYLLEPQALAKAAENLETEYPEFAALMKEFRDGILIFRLEDENVYKKLKYEEEGGMRYFDAHRDEYMTETKLALSEIFLYKETEVEDVQQQLKSGTATFEQLAKQFTQRQGYRDREGKWNLASPKNADIVRQVLMRVEQPRASMVLEPFQYQGGWSIVRIDTVDAARRMSYDEAKSELMGDYIDFLEKKLKNDMAAELRKKYTVSINTKVLDKALAAK